MDYIGYHYRCSEDSICRRYNSDMMNILLEFYHKAVEFVEGYHCGDVNYERMLGVLATKIHEDLRETMFFNATGYMPVKEYLYYMGIYYDDPAVKKYIKKARTSDFHRFRDKLSFVLLSGEHVYLYYYIGAFLRKTKSCFRKIACAQNRNVQKEMR